MKAFVAAAFWSSWALASPPSMQHISHLVTFGDSYADLVRTGDPGGVTWPMYAADYANLSLSVFARSGATCSHKLTPRPFPSLFESQLPAYLEQKASLNLVPQETIYTLWIGTNDVGLDALLTGRANASLVDVATCMVNWVKVLYESGARNFMFQNMIPLQNVPLYALDSYPNKFWTAARNTTEWSIFMTELVLSGNALTKLMLQALTPTLPGAHINLFDSYSLFADMFTHPSRYLNGTAPRNVTGAVISCIFELDDRRSPADCTYANGTDRDSFLWFDELHPSEQADRIVAREIAAIIKEQGSRWATWLS